MCSYLHCSKSGYYAYEYRLTHPKLKEVSDENDFKLIKQAYDYKGRHKGARQIKMVLFNVYDTVMNLKKIRRLMRKYNLFCPIRKANPYRRMMKALKTSNYAFNHLNRNFNIQIPGRFLLTDITYIFYGKERKLCYCSTIKDSATHEILAYKISQSLNIDFVLDTVKQLPNHKFIDLNRVMINSDQGVHYTSCSYIALLNKLNITRSMSRRGNCWDNAPQESFFGHMKDELHLKECDSYEAVCNELNDYFDYYNNHRYQWNLNKMTPVQYRNYLLAQPSTELILFQQNKLPLNAIAY